MIDKETNAFNGKIYYSTNYKENRLISPPIVFLQITDQCNLRCKHCFTQKHYNKNRKNLSTSELIKLLNELECLGVCEVIIGGGEPLLRKDLFDIINYCNELHIRPSFTTNGTLVNNEILCQLKKIKVGYIKVSLDGPKEIHEEIREKGTFDLAIEGIKKIVDIGIDVGIRTVLTSLNLNDIEQLINIAEQIKCKSITFSTLRPSGMAAETPELLNNLNKENYRKALDKIIMLKEKHQINISISEDAPYIQGVSKDNGVYEELLPQFGCPAKGSVCEIDAYGNVSPCGFLKGLLGEKMIGGNIRDDDFIDIWNKSAPFEVLRDLKFPNKCKKCTKYCSCFGGCRTRAYFAHNQFDSPDYLCPYN